MIYKHNQSRDPPSSDMRCWWQNNHGDARNGLSHFSWSQVQNVYFKWQAQLVGQTEQGPHVTSEDLSLGGRNGFLVLELALNALTPWSVSVSCLDF